MNWEREGKQKYLGAHLALDYICCLKHLANNSAGVSYPSHEFLLQNTFLGKYVFLECILTEVVEGVVFILYL